MEEINNALLRELSMLKESEDHIEFKEAKRNFNWDGGEHKNPKERRHCILGYVAALANEKGGRLVFGMKDHRPHEIVGTTFEQGNLGALENAIYDKLQIRVPITEEFEPSKEDPNRKRVIIFNVPSRPIGKMLKYEGVPLMRTGESLREMSDSEIFKILSEQEPDFSAKPCEGLTMDDLDAEALVELDQADRREAEPLLGGRALDGPGTVSLSHEIGHPDRRDPPKRRLVGIVDAEHPRLPPEALERRHHIREEPVYGVIGLVAHLERICHGVEPLDRALVRAVGLVGVARALDGQKAHARHLDDGWRGLGLVEVAVLPLEVEGHVARLPGMFLP